MVTRYNDEPAAGGEETEAIEGYRDGVDRVVEYIVSIHRYDGLVNELRWAIHEGII